MRGVAIRLHYDECETRTQLHLRGREAGRVTGGCYGFRRWGMPSVSDILTSSASEPASILRITWPRWTLTVSSLMPSSPAICLLRKPETTHAITSPSRGVSDAYRARSA